MNRFTDLSKSVRQEIEDQRLSAESEADREKRLAGEKRKAEVRLLNERVVPILEEARNGLGADSIVAEVRLREGMEPAAALIIDGGLDRVDDRTFKLGETYEVIVTTAGGAFVIKVKGGANDPTDTVAREGDLNEVLFDSFGDLLRRYHGTADGHE